MDNKFIDFCLTNDKYLYIKFTRQMVTCGEHSIKLASNYSVQLNHTINSLTTLNNLSLDKLVSEVSCCGDYLVSFKLKECSPSLVNAKLFCGYTSLTTVLYVTDTHGCIHDFSCANDILLHSNNPSITNCSAQVTSDKTLFLEDFNTIPLTKLSINDFYLMRDEKKITPYTLKFNSDTSFTIYFNSEIIKYNKETLKLFTNSKCFSEDCLGNTLIPNEHIITSNSLPTLPVSLSIFSYVDDILGVALEFTDIIRRYDSNDFYFCINGKRYNAKGRVSHNKDNIIFFFIYDVFDFNYNSSTINITYKKLPIPYTLDKNLSPLVINNKISSKFFYGTNAVLDNTINVDIGLLTINFNSFLLKSFYSLTGYFNTFDNLKTKAFSPTILEHSPYLKLIATSTYCFYIENLILMLFHLTNTENISESSHSTEITLSENKLIAEIDLSNRNFLTSIKDKIDYIEIIPLVGIKNHNYISPISTIEIPTELLINDNIELVFKPNEQHIFERLLGTTVTNPTTILVNKISESYNYGNMDTDKKIIFTNDLYIKSINSIIIFEKPVIDILNFQGNTLYVSLDDNYYINFDNCHFEDVIIL